MDLKELDYIVTVANEGSISRAAEKLFMAQSSLSQAVRLFEQDLGTPIFVRTARGVRPTSAGEAFIFHARQILQQYQEARSEASDIENLKGGTVIFGISTYRGTFSFASTSSGDQVRRIEPGNLPAAAGPEKIPCPVSTSSCGDL